MQNRHGHRVRRTCRHGHHADMGNDDFGTWTWVAQTWAGVMRSTGGNMPNGDFQTWVSGLQHMQTWALGNRFASCADMGNRFAERVSWGVRTSAFQVRSCGVRFVVGALSAQSGQGMHETGRVDSPGAGCLVGPAQKTPFFGRFREVFFPMPPYRPVPVGR